MWRARQLLNHKTFFQHHLRTKCTTNSTNSNNNTSSISLSACAAPTIAMAVLMAMTYLECEYNTFEYSEYESDNYIQTYENDDEYYGHLYPSSYSPSNQRVISKDSCKSWSTRAIPTSILSSPSSSISIPTVHAKNLTQCESAQHEYSPTSAYHILSSSSRDTTHNQNKTKTKSTPKTNPNLFKTYKLNKKTKPLGEGSFATVHKAIHIPTSQPTAIKQISKNLTTQSSFINEVQALQLLSSNGGHPHINQLKDTTIYEDKRNYYIVLDVIEGGEMFDHLISSGAYSEMDAARLVGEVANALSFIHGLGLIHADLKPENIMLSTDRKDDCVIKVVDFGCARQVIDTDSDSTPSDIHTGKKDEKDAAFSDLMGSSLGGITPAYSPPEVLEIDITGVSDTRLCNSVMRPPVDMWSLGIILYIMLTGLHPFDLDAKATDEQIEERIRHRKSPPLRGSPITAHLSSSAIDVIEALIQWDPKDRITALELLEHPWIRGETARTNKMVDSDKKLSMFRVFKSKLEAKVFADFFSWSDDDQDALSRASLVERAFRSFDSQDKGFLTSTDLRKLTNKGSSNISSSSSHVANQPDNNLEGNTHEDDRSRGGSSSTNSNESLCLSGFSDLLSENMKNKHFPGNYQIYKEGDTGNHMYFINAGTVKVTTSDGSTATRGRGDFFGEGALLHPRKLRSATISTVTPVHALEISREYFEKYLASSDKRLSFNLKEKDKIRKRNRAKTILRLQNNLKQKEVHRGEVVFSVGEEGDALYILETGEVDLLVGGKRVFTAKPGDIFGEHSLIMGRPRNTSAVCMSEKCLVYEMKSRDFYHLYNSSSSLRTSLRELCLRREFQKALVKKTGKEFPSIHDLRGVFDAADADKSGLLSANEVSQLLRSFDPSLSEEEMDEVVQSLDLDESGLISFDEFSLIFGINERLWGKSV